MSERHGESAMADELRPRLGRGLAALIGGPELQAARDKQAGQKTAPIEQLRTNPRNPRKNFDEAALEDLAASIREKGILQPILVRTVAGAAAPYEIIAGERRWRAAQLAGLHEVPIIAVEADDRQALELAIIENVQRSDLNALEEAAGYQKLGADYGYSQADLAKVIGKSRSHVANTLRLLKLPARTQGLLAEGTISAGHARALLGSAEPDALAERIVAEGLTVRDVERIVQAQNSARPEVATAHGATRPHLAPAEPDADTRALEKALSDALGLTVTITYKGEAGELKIRYSNFDQLDSVCRLLKPES
jgi:ParB family chromosome partitioning protein